MVLSYLMKQHQWTLLESINHIKKSRDFIQPNEGFIQQLLDYEKDLHPDKYPSLKLEDLDFDSD